MFDDVQETPNTLTATFEFDTAGKKKVMVGEGGKAPNTVGAVFYGSKGYLSVWDEDHGRYQSYLGREQEPGPSGSDIANNWANFIAALRTRKHEDLNAPIEEGAVSTTLVHLANIAYRLGRTLNFDSANSGRGRCRG
jgi:hypothetical protein